MKTNSDNFRESAIQEIIERLLNEGLKVIIYEPILEKNSFKDCYVINDFNKFCEESDVILANRYESKLDEVKEKVYTRDIFARD